MTTFRQFKRRGRFALLLTVTIGALIATAVALGAASSGSGSTAAPCAQTGNESLLSDQSSYQPGDTVQFTGSGFAPDCAVSIHVTRPDGVVATGSATTDDAGALAYEYTLPSSPGIDGVYQADALGVGGTILASVSFTDALAATASVGLKNVYRGSSGLTYTFTINNTSSSSETIGSIRITRPGGTWSLQTCPTLPTAPAPVGWTGTLGGAGGSMCTYNSGAGTGDDIAAGG